MGVSESGERSLISIDNQLSVLSLGAHLDRFWNLSESKLELIEERMASESVSPVFTVEGKYATRGWTDWTQGFRIGSHLLQYEATGKEKYLESGSRLTYSLIPEHITHFGVHDHGFNVVSTYGNLRRLARRGRMRCSPDAQAHIDLALKASAAVQARRWTALSPNRGYIYSFNGPHSLFADTMRSLRSLAIGHLLGHTILLEHDERVSLLDRLCKHVTSTHDYIVYFGQGRDVYDEFGRTAHEAIFNIVDGRYRCSSTQQGYSAFSTWTRGQAWVLCGAAELIEFVRSCETESFPLCCSKAETLARLHAMATATAEHFLASTPSDGIAYWDTGAPGLRDMIGHRDKPADPFNDHEPVDASASAIAALGLLHLSRAIGGDDPDGRRYRQAALTITKRLLSDDYLSLNPRHEGLLLHVIYHRPNGWDYVPPGRKIPCGESCMWGDYHLRELALFLKLEVDETRAYRFF